VSSEVKTRFTSEGGPRVAAEARGLAKALDRLRNRRFDADTRPGVNALNRYGLSAKRADDALQRLSRGADRAFRAMGRGVLVGTAAIGAGLYSSVKAAAEFEQTIANVSSVSSASRRELKLLGDQALKLGASTKFSAREAAAAQFELAKAGVSVKDILGGALPGALALAAAGDIELADSAKFAANAMKLFGLQAKDITGVADAFATAANTTTADVSDFGMALTQGGAASKLAGLSFRDTMVILEALAAAGVKNSDAGTSMKAALLQLINPSVKQAALQKELGIQLIDNNGKLKDAAGLSAELRRVTEGLNTTERARVLAILAGQDGIRTLNALYQAGPKTLRDYDRALGAHGTAAETAAKRQQSFSARVEQLQGALETIRIRIGRAFLPALTGLADKTLRDVTPKLEKAAKRIESVWNQAGMSTEEKLSRSWDAIADTGIPDKVKDGVYQGLAAIGREGPKWLVRGLQEAPWPAKGVIAALLLAKLAPAIGFLGPALGKALGGIGGKGLGGASKGAPVPVYVVNGGVGLGGPNGGPVPGAPGGKVGRLGRLGSLAAGGGFAGAAIPLAAGAGLVLGGMGLNSVVDKTGIPGGILPSAEEARKNTERIQNQVILAWRKGRPALQAEIQKGMVVPAGPIAQRMATAATAASAAFAASLGRGKGKAKESANNIVTAAYNSLRGLTPAAGRLAADTMIRYARSLEDKGKAAKGSTARLVAMLERELGKLPAASRDAARSSAASFGELQMALRNVADTARDTYNRIKDVDRAGASISAGQYSVRSGFASGGIIPGTYRGHDTHQVWVAPGERIMRPDQVALADSGVPVDMAILSTGGRIGGPGFASGGIVDDVYSRIQSKMHTKYVYGAWDCSKFATWAVNPSATGSTAWAYSNSSPAKGTEPIIWGLRNNGSGNVYDGGKDEHMGIGVLHNGRRVWFDNGGHSWGSGVDSDSDSARWEVYRVPRGLEGLTAGSESDDTKRNTKGKGSPLQMLTKALLGVGFDPKGGSKAGSPDSARGVAKTILAETPDYSGTTPGTNLSGAQTRAQSGAGRAAMARARRAGKSPDEVAKAGAEAERTAEVKYLNKNLLLAKEDMSLLLGRKQTLLGQLRKVQTAKRSKPGAKRAAARAIRAKLAAVTAEMLELREVIAEVNARLLDIGEEVAEERYQENYENEQERRDAAAAAATDPATTPGLTDAQQAELDKTKAAEALARRSAGLSEAFIRTAFSPGDIATGGRTAWDAAGGVVYAPTTVIQTLHPTDPRTLRAINDANTSALSSTAPRLSSTVLTGL
jgi:TP901 family phage tail tape measure protein